MTCLGKLLYRYLLFMYRIIHILFFAYMLLTACAPGSEQRDWNLTPDSLRHSSLLSIAHADSFVLVTVKNAWVEGKDLHRYILVPDSAPMPQHYPEGTVLRTPLRSVVMHNAVHAALVEELGCASAIKGLCDVEYVHTPALRQLLDNGNIADAGSSVQSDVEHYISLRADAVFTAPIEHASYGILEKVGIPLVECADYMEASALGRVEWVRFFGLLFDCEDRANALLEAVEKRYSALCSIAQKATHRPRLMADVLHGAAWYMPGGKSYLGNLFADAGADYILADDEHSGSIPLSFETVFSLAADADFWLIKEARAGVFSYADLRREHASYTSFAPWKKRNIYCCNTLHTDFYEHIPFHPDVLLLELVQLFHSELFPTPTPAIYYLPLKQPF